MSSEVPSDLIKQSQIEFREDAGLSSYKPTLKSLPTVQNSLETSDNCIKCKHCNAKLLRGSHSLICIYCGQCQAKDLPPQPIVFNSTTSSRLLLQSLNLDASETTGSFFEENIRNKGGTSAEVGITLAEVLDVKIEWRDEIEIPETGFVNKAFDYNSLLNLDKVGLENFVTGSVGDDAEINSRNSNEDSNVSFDLRDNSSSHNAETEFVNSRPENEDYKTDLNRNSSSLNFRSDSKFATVSSDLKGVSSTGSDTEIQKDGAKTESIFTNQNEDSKSNVAKDELNIQSPNFMTQNEDSKLRADDEEKIQSMNFSTQNEEFKTTSASDSIRDSSSDDTEIKAQNDDSKTAVLSSDLRDDSSLGDDLRDSLS